MVMWMFQRCGRSVYMAGPAGTVHAQVMQARSRAGHRKIGHTPVCVPLIMPSALQDCSKTKEPTGKQKHAKKNYSVASGAKSR